MIDDSKYTMISNIESSGANGFYAVKILVMRPPGAQARVDALNAKDYGKCTPEERRIKYMVPDAETLVSALRRQDRMLDPMVVQSAQDTKARIEAAFNAAGAGLIYMEAIPNGYHAPDTLWAVGVPWYRVTTSVGHFVVGWRKRVIHLEWKDTVLRARKTVGVPSGEEVFPGEDVTRWETGIHAWSYAKLVEYVRTLIAWPIDTTELT